MKIVILSSRFPFPIEKGDKLRLYHQMREIAEDYEVHLISLTEEEISTDELRHVESFCETVTVFRLNPYISRISALKGFLNTKPFQVNYFFRDNIKVKINRLVESIGPDLVYCQLIRMAEYAKELKYSKVLDYMDAFSLSSKRRSEHHSTIKKWFFRNESLRLYQYENEVSSYFDHLTIISNQDKLHLINKSLVPVDKLSIISNGIDVDYFAPNEKESREYDILFVGNMGYHPNVLAAKFLINDVAPMLSGSCKFQIAGTRPTASVKALAKHNVVVTGWMNDIRKAYNNSRIFVAPIFSGAGQQNKILEAMSMGLPCITTSIVNEGIGAEDGKNILVADNKQAFAEKCKILLEDKDFYLVLSKEGRSFVENNFSWHAENQKLVSIIDKVKK